MAYDKDKLLKEALDKAEEKNCFFIEQLVSFMPCDRSTFYRLFDIKSDEYNTINEVLDKNKVLIKSQMYNKWFDSDNATLQIALMKLIATDAEAHRINGSKSEVKLEGDVNIQIMQWAKNQ